MTLRDVGEPLRVRFRTVSCPLANSESGPIAPPASGAALARLLHLRNEVCVEREWRAVKVGVGCGFAVELRVG
jgi:hypothetical protein